jgi:hypothetical protein
MDDISSKETKNQNMKFNNHSIIPEMGKYYLYGISEESDVYGIMMLVDEFNMIFKPFKPLNNRKWQTVKYKNGVPRFYYTCLKNTSITIDI